MRTTNQLDSQLRRGRALLAALAVAALLAVGAGLWWGGMYYARVNMNVPSMDQAATPGTHDQATADRNMKDMPGMNMSGMSESGAAGEKSTSAPSGVPGYAEVTVAPGVQRRIGVTVGEVEQAPLTMSVRTVGIVQPNETRVQHVHLKREGWIEKLYVNFTGQKVNKGDPLLSIYSPDFLIAQSEYLVARQSANRPPIQGLPSLVESARVKMQLWDVPEEEIDALDKTGTPQKNLIMQSKISGTVLMKDAFEGQQVMPDRDLFIIADLSTVWVQSKVYEYDLPHVELGQPAIVRVPAMPKQDYSGKVNFIGPTVDEATRTVAVRVELPNGDGVFKPGMFVDIEIQHNMGEGLLVPATAVIRTGTRDIAFRIGEDNRFVPVEVKLGTVKFGDRFQILEGLSAGEKVVTSANFLIDSESRLRSGGGMAGMPGMDMGGMKKESKQTEKMDSMPGMNESKPKNAGESKMEEMKDSQMDDMDHSQTKK